MNPLNATEVFYPYNHNKEYLLLTFLELRKTEDSMFSDIMVVEYKGEEYELVWDEHYSYYSGKVNNIKGFLP